MVVVSHRPSFLGMCDREFIIENHRLISQRDNTDSKVTPLHPERHQTHA